MQVFDAIVIGSGQAGPSMANALVGAGQRVALAEGYRFGGSCVNYGCRPTKVLIASAHAVHIARRGADFGFRTDGLQVDWGRVRERVVGIIEHTSSEIEGWLRGMDGLTVYHAYAHFEGKADGLYQVRMGEEVVAAPRVFLNTGTRARVPTIPGAENTPWLDSEKLLRLEALPEHLVVLGGSYIGLEMGQAFRRLGSRVTIIETSDCIINREDPAIKHELYRILTDEGIVIHTGSSPQRAEPTADGGVRLVIREGQGQEQVITGSHWLNAIGRVPNTDRLNLAAVGVEADSRGFVTVNDFLETTAPGVYALGDINGKGAFTHTAYQDYQIVRDNLLRGRERRWRDRTMAYALYTDPPLGRVGMSEAEARASGRRVLAASKPMSQIGRAIEQAETAGYLQVLVDAETERFLGATAFGFHGDEVAQVVSNYMASGATYHAMMEALPIHPTVSEFLPSMLEELKALE